MDRPELADFLRRSRDRLRPHEVGLPDGPRRRTPGLRREEVTQLTATPAQILTDLGDLLAQNALANTLFGAICSPHTHDCAQDHNVLWRWFNDPAARDAFPADEQDVHGHRLVAGLRAAVARRGHDADATALVDRLSATSPEFSALWRLHEVAVPHHTRMRLRHPAVGPIVLDCEVLLTPSDDQRLVVYTAPPGTESTDRLALLQVLGTARFAPDR